MKNPRRSAMVAFVAALSLAATPIVLAGCGDDAEDAVNNATSEAGDAVEGATSAADEAIENATSSADEAIPGDDDAGQVVQIAAAENLKFAKTKASAKAGKVTLRMPNPTAVPHNIAIDLNNEDDVVGEIVEKGGTSEAGADLDAAQYEYYCSVPGHREAGMVGTLTVK